MTVPSSTSRDQQTGNGVTLAFTVPFRILEASHLRVLLTVGGVTTEQTITTHYAVTGVGDPSATVTFVTAPANGSTITFLRNVPFTQETDYVPNDPFPAESHERALDKATMIAQQISERQDRALTLAEEVSGVSTQLPSPIPLRPLVWNAAGTAYENGSTELTGDMLLRGELASTGAGKGSALVGFPDTLATAYLKTASDIINGLPVSIHRFLPPAQIAAIIAGTSTYDATADFQTAYNAFPARGGKLILPRGDYYLTNDATITDKPFTIEGEGSNISRIIQSGAGKNGVTFTATGANTVTGDGVQTKALTIRGVCFMRSGTSGGAAIRGSWVSATSNVPFCILDDVRVAERNGLSLAFLNGLHLTNVNGLRANRLAVWGDANAASTATAAPFLMQNMLLLDGDAVEGKINHFLSQISGGYANTLMKVDGWYEGFYTDQIEVANVGEGYRLLGEASSRCTNFQIDNGHVDFRTAFIVADKWQNVVVSDVDAYKAGGVSGTGFAATAVSLTACPCPRLNNVKIENTHSAATSGISVDATSVDGSLLGGQIKGCNGTGASISGANWRLNDTHYQSNGTAIYANASNTRIGDGNSYASNTTNVAFGAGTGSANGTGVYHASIVVTLTGGAVTENLDIPIPAGTFLAKPSACSVFGSGTDTLGFYEYDSASSTATNARVVLRNTQGTNLAAGSARFSVAMFR